MQTEQNVREDLVFGKKNKKKKKFPTVNIFVRLTRSQSQKGTEPVESVLRAGDKL